MNLLEDLSIITTIPVDTFNKLSDKSILCISDEFYESILDKNELTDINIGIGRLLIKVEDDQIKYKFIPSANLQAVLKSTYLEKNSALKKEVDTSLVKKLTQIYKDIL